MQVPYFAASNGQAWLGQVVKIKTRKLDHIQEIPCGCGGLRRWKDGTRETRC
jgi:hypothetical protein